MPHSLQPLISARSWPSALGLSLLLVGSALILSACNSEGSAATQTPGAASAPVRAALTVEAIQPRSSTLARLVQADGNIMAWHEASVGAEVSGKILAVPVEVGDRVRRGQVLARFDTDILSADHSRIEASALEAAAAYAEAQSSAERARKLHAQGFMGDQMLVQSQTLEATAQARMKQARAAREASRINLENATVRATADGIISRVNVVKGSIIPAGTEMFALIEAGRLEWRAQVNASDMAQIRVGMPASVEVGHGQRVAGKVRLLSPTVDVQSRKGLVYIDLQPSEQARAGMYVTGGIEIGKSPALLLPQGAVLLRDGFSYVMRIKPDQSVEQVTVQLGQRIGGEIEILQGLQAQDRVVAKGAAFLADGDSVQISASPTAQAEATPTEAAPAQE